MIVYDLICSFNHNFEGWFQDLEDLEKQLEQSLVVCPLCGDNNIIRIPSTFGLMKNVKSDTVYNENIGLNLNKEDLTKRLIKNVEKLSEKVINEYDDVGVGFTDEALKMHYGVSEKRNIRGISTPQQEDLLKKEGVEFRKIPFINKKPKEPSNSN